MHLTRTSYSSLALIVIASACSKPRSTPQAAATASASEASPTTSRHLRYPLVFEPNAEQVALADRLAASVDTGSWMFPKAELGKPENAPVYAYLAATDARPEVVGAALRGLLHALSAAPVGTPTQPLTATDLNAVLADNIASPQTRLQARALDVARNLIRRDAASPLVDKILATVPKATTAPSQYELLDAVAALPVARRRTALNEFVGLATGLEPFVFARLLEEETKAWRNASPPTAVFDMARTATRNGDQTVRGRAVEFLGSTGRSRPGVEETVLERFGDESPYVLAQAAFASARLHIRPAAHALVKLLDDDRPDRIESKPWRTPEGGTGRRIHGGPSSKTTVSLAAFQALAALSDGALKPEPPQPGDTDGGHSRNVKAAKAWYQKAKRDIPKASPAAAQSAQAASSAKPHTVPVSATAH